MLERFLNDDTLQRLASIRSRVASVIAPPTSDVSKSVPVFEGFDFNSQGMGHVHYFNGIGGAVGDVAEVNAMTAYAAAVYCYAAVQYRARNVSEPALRVVQEVDDRGFEAFPHPLDELLQEPSLDYDMGETIWLTQASLDTFGRALWVGDVDRMERLAQLMPFMGDEMRVHAANGRLFGRYEVLEGGSGGTWVDRLPEEVVHFRYLSPHSRHNAASPTDVALSWLNLGVTTKAHVKRMMANGMFPSMVLSPHHEWHPDPDEFDRFKAELEKYHAGPANSGKPFTMLGGGTVTQASHSLKDMLPDEILNRVEANVAAAFGVAPVILGFLVGLINSPWSQMAEARKQTIEDTIVPLWRTTYEKVLTRQLLRRLDPTSASRRLFVQFDLSQVIALQADLAGLVETAAAATHWTLDERRLHSQQEAIGGERGEWVEVIDRPAFNDPRGPGVNDPDGAKRLPARATQYSLFQVRTQRHEGQWLKAASEQLGRDALRLAAAVLELPAFAEEYATAGKAAPFTEGARQWVAAQQEIDTKNASGLAEMLLAAIDSDAEWQARLDPLVVSQSKEAARDAATQAGLAPSLVDSSAVEFAERHAAQLVKQITKTNRKKLVALIADAIAAGDPVEVLAKSIVDATGFSLQRARLIASTEVIAVSNGAQRKAMSDFQREDPEALVEKSWLSARDHLVRDEHVKLDDGEYIPIDDPFANGLQEPSEPRCRCTAVYRIKERAA